MTVLVACAVLALAQEDLEGDVDVFLAEDFEEPTMSRRPSTTRAPNTAALERVLIAQQKELVRLWNSTQRVNNLKRVSDFFFQQERHTAGEEWKKFQRLALAVRLTKLNETIIRRRAPTAFQNLRLGVDHHAVEQELALFTSMTVIFGVFLVVLAVAAALMVKHRTVVEGFWVALVVLAMLACCVNIVCASLGRLPRDFGSPIMFSFDVLEFIVYTLLAAMVATYAVVLCKALYLVVFPDKGAVPRLAMIAPFAVVGCACCYGMFAVFYPYFSGNFLYNVSTLVFMMLTSAIALVLTVACAAAAVKSRSPASIGMVGASLVLFLAWTVLTVLRGLFSFFYFDQFTLECIVVLIQAITLVEVVVFLLLSLTRISKGKQSAADASGYSELQEEDRIPLRYAEF